MTSKPMLGSAAIFLVLALGTVVGAAHAEDQPIKRTELLRADLAGLEGKQAVIYIADLAPGAVGGKHTHYGDEFVYILQGGLIVEPVGKDPIALKAGEVGHLMPDVVHAARNASAADPGKVLVILVIDKDKPLAQAVE